MARFLQILSLLVSLAIFSSRLAHANPAAAANNSPGDNDSVENSGSGSGSGSNDNVNSDSGSNEDIIAEYGEELGDVRQAAYLAMVSLCHLCSFVIEDYRRPIQTVNRDTIGLLNVIRDSLVCFFVSFGLVVFESR